MRLSVIIPVLNEERRLALRLAELERMEGVSEVIVVDGGSREPPTSANPKVRIMEAARGRAVQMNAGARAASGDTLLFLHADVSLPEDASRWVEQLLSERGVVAGAFRTWTVADLEPWRFAPLLHLADLRSRYSRLPYGDQAIFLRAETFRSVGGFPEQPLMEDLEFSIRLSRMGRIVTAPASVRVSGRRFIHRPLTYTFLVNVFPALYRMGVPPAWLARVYRQVR